MLIGFCWSRSHVDREIIAILLDSANGTCEIISVSHRCCFEKKVANMLLTFSFQKRQLAAQSGIFNSKNTTFCELFPEIVEVSVTTFNPLTSDPTPVILRGTCDVVVFNPI